MPRLHGPRRGHVDAEKTSAMGELEGRFYGVSFPHRLQLATRSFKPVGRMPKMPAAAGFLEMNGVQGKFPLKFSRACHF
jgi:hypothetical protein